MLSSSLATLCCRFLMVSNESLLVLMASVKAPPVLVATPHSSAPSPPRMLARGVPTRLTVWKLGGGEVSIERIDGAAYDGAADCGTEFGSPVLY
jgi:hypothetical protein